MSWLSAFTWNVKNLFTMDVANNKVHVIKAEDCSYKVIVDREDSLVLYEPNGGRDRYELVLHRPCDETLEESFSLSRYYDRQIAEKHFELFRHKIPKYVSLCKGVQTVASLQKLCDLIRDNPDWNLAHIVTHLGHAELLTEPDVMALINTEEKKSGVSPLQLAIKDLNVRVVQTLLSCDASVTHVDYKLNSVLHYAASTNKQIVNLLCEKSKVMLNCKNAVGYTPLHKACLSDKPECVHALLQAGADVNITVTQCDISTASSHPVDVRGQKLDQEDMKDGGTPLHWACSAAVVEELCKNCDINIPNFDNRTALHVMVIRKRMECLVALLANNANCNIGDKDGNTPLHLAVQEGNEAMVKALIVFGADLHYRNNYGHTPRHNVDLDTPSGQKILYILHAVGAPRCAADVVNCNRGCAHNEAYEGLAPTPPISSPPRDLLDNLLDMNRVPQPPGKDQGRLLSLDGGGIRGLVLIVILMELEKKMENPIIKYFDWVAGTSTGGILALALCCGKTLRECLMLYFKMKNAAFSGKKPYSSEIIEKILKSTFGENLTMASIKSPKVMITGVLADRLPIDFHFFRNYPSASEILGMSQESGDFAKVESWERVFLWHVARATGAAPTYFKPFGNFLDGGLIANNPTLDAITEIVEYTTAVKCSGDGERVKNLSLVVSLGTGLAPVTKVDLKDNEMSLRSMGGFISIATYLLPVLIEQSTQTRGRVVDRARAWCSSMGVAFFRFCPQLSEDVALDEKNDEILTNMLWETMAYMRSREQESNDLARLLAVES